MIIYVPVFSPERRLGLFHYLFSVGECSAPGHTIPFDSLGSWFLHEKLTPTSLKTNIKTGVEHSKYEFIASRLELLLMKFARQRQPSEHSAAYVTTSRRSPRAYEYNKRCVHIYFYMVHRTPLS